jgi:hypothetical protein
VDTSLKEFQAIPGFQSLIKMLGCLDLHACILLVTLLVAKKVSASYSSSKPEFILKLHTYPFLHTDRLLRKYLQERLQRCAFRCKDAAEESLPKTAKEAEIKKAQARTFRAGSLKLLKHVQQAIYLTSMTLRFGVVNLINACL